jgi:mRNA interferase RelE/StbE
MWNIVYSRHIDHARFLKLPANDRERIQKAIEEKLRTHPETFGKPLHQSLFGCRSLRVGEYRVIYLLKKHTVEILLIGHRSNVYESAKRLFP